MFGLFKKEKPFNPFTHTNRNIYVQHISIVEAIRDLKIILNNPYDKSMIFENIMTNRQTSKTNLHSYFTMNGVMLEEPDKNYKELSKLIMHLNKVINRDKTNSRITRIGMYIKPIKDLLNIIDNLNKI